MRFFKSYFFATLVQSGTSFVVMALLARMFVPQEFGRWVLIEPAVLILSQVGLIGANYGVIKLIAQDNINVKTALVLTARKVIRWQILIFFLVTSAAIFLTNSSMWSLLIGCWMLIEGAFALLMSALRGANYPSAYVFGVVVRSGAAIFVFLGDWIFDVKVLRIAEHSVLVFFLSTLLSVLFLLVYLWRCKENLAIKINNEDQMASSSLRYGAPILLGAILSFVVANADRYVIGVYFDPVTVGNYAIAVKVASALTLLIAPINLWWPTARFAHLKDPDGGAEFFGRATLQLQIFFLMASGALWLAAPTLMSLLSPTAVFSPVIQATLIGAIFFTAMTTPLAIGLLKEGNTHWIPIALAISAVLQISLALWLGRDFGVSGVATATMISSLISLALQFGISRKFHPVHIPIVKMISCFTWFAVSVLLSFILLDGPVLRVIAFGVICMPCLFIVRKEIHPFAK